MEAKQARKLSFVGRLSNESFITLFMIGVLLAVFGRVIRITTAAAEKAAVEQTEWAVGAIESRVSAQVAAEVAGEEGGPGGAEPPDVTRTAKPCSMGDWTGAGLA